MFFTLQFLRYCDSSQCHFLLSSLNLKVSYDVELERWRCLFGGLRPPGCHSRLCIIHSHLSQVSESHRYQTLYDFQGKKHFFLQEERMETSRAKSCYHLIFSIQSLLIFIQEYILRSLWFEYFLVGHSKESVKIC